MRIAICQINPIIGDFAYNRSIILEALEQAKGQKCHLAIFPELSILGYPPKDLLERPSFIEKNLETLHDLAQEVQNIHALCGFVEKNPQQKETRPFNSVALLGKGKLLKTGAKRLLPTYDVFDETRYFDPGPKSLTFELEGVRLGVTICEDIWNIGDFEKTPHYDLDPLSDLFDEGLNMMVNISASPYTLGKALLRMKILKTISSQYHVPSIYCNQVGGNDDLLFDGASMVLDEQGHLILQAKEFDQDLLVYDTTVNYQEITEPWSSEEDSVLKGLTLGTRDYVQKCGFKKALVGLSGGIDSTLVAVIARMALGSENVMGVSLPSPYTSELSKRCAKQLAQNLGIQFEEIPIGDIFKVFKQSLSPVFKGLEEDTTEENLQARIRANLLMALSNKFNALLLTTGNKSELATGYCTLYGDMCGGLAVISDIPKMMCYRLAKYINRDQEIIPQEIITRPPSAELKPDQTDQDSLPPYETLDQILEAAIVQNLSIEEIIQRGHDPDTVRDVFRRLIMNEYKRRQAPPGLKITTKAFGYGRRYPIACGRDVF
jgi:NAD+ synthetase